MKFLLSRFWWLPLVAIMLWGAHGIARSAEFVVPAPSGFVVDEVGLIKPVEKRDLTVKLGTLQKKGISAAILFPQSLQGLPITEYRQRVAETWMIGRRGVDNGVLIVIAPNERKIGISTGYGAEGLFPDAMTYSWTQQMGKLLTKGNEQWAAAASVPVDAMLQITSAAYPTPRKAGGDWTTVLLALAAFLVVMGYVFVYERRREWKADQAFRRAEAEAAWGAYRTPGTKRYVPPMAGTVAPLAMVSGVGAAAAVAAASTPWRESVKDRQTRLAKARGRAAASVRREAGKKKGKETETSILPAVAAAAIGYAVGSSSRNSSSSDDSSSSSSSSGSDSGGGGSFDSGGGSFGGGGSDSSF